MASPTGQQILEVTPFIRVDYDDRLNQERVFLLRQTVKGKHILLVNDDTGVEKKVLVDAHDGELPFIQWLDTADHSALLLQDDEPGGSLQGPDIAQLGNA